MAVMETATERVDAAVTRGYEQVLDLARQQCEAIRQGQLERFLQLLEERFVVSERLRVLSPGRPEGAAEGPEVAEIRRQVLRLDNLMATLLRDAIARRSPGCRAGTA